MFMCQVFGEDNNVQETDFFKFFCNKIIRWIGTVQKYLSAYKLYCSLKIRCP